MMRPPPELLVGETLQMQKGLLPRPGDSSLLTPFYLRLLPLPLTLLKHTLKACT